MSYGGPSYIMWFWGGMSWDTNGNCITCCKITLAILLQDQTHHNHLNRAQRFCKKLLVHRTSGFKIPLALSNIFIPYRAQEYLSKLPVSPSHYFHVLLFDLLVPIMKE